MLLDPRTDPAEPLYVGKGLWNRVFAHCADALASATESDKLDRIRAIHAEGLQVQHVILRHGLTDDQASEVEAAFIDFLPNLSNVASGRHSRTRGLMTVEELIAEYEAPAIAIREPAVLIKINRLYRRGMTDKELYDATRKSWVVSRTSAARARIALAVASGIVRQVYRIEEWYPSEDNPQRWAFRGRVAEYLQEYVGGSVAHLTESGAQNPIRYVNL